MRISHKSRLVEVLSWAQVSCLLLALFGFAFWVRTSLQEIVRQQIMGDNQLIASQMSKMIEGNKFDSIEYGSRDWDRLQTLIEDIELPNQGYMCVANNKTGKLLCHPQIRNFPGLREVNIGATDFIVGNEKSTILSIAKTIAGSDINNVRTGILNQGEDTQVVSAAHLPVLNAVLLVHQSEKSTITALNKILFPIVGIGLIVGLVLVLITRRTSLAILNRYENMLAELNEGLEQTVHDRTQALVQTRDAVIFGLAKLSESRDSDTGEHLDRIRVYVTLLAKEYASRHVKLDSQFLNDIGLASSLHDIGKVGIPDHVLLKPGKLESFERSLMEIHPTIGSSCLAAIEERLGENGFLSLASEICAYHHEKWDGTGYPAGLAGTAIPLSARIVAIADVYDALRVQRPYKQAFSHEKACEIIIQGSGSHFDPDLVDTFLHIESVLRENSEAFATHYSLQHEINEMNTTELLNAREATLVIL